MLISGIAQCMEKLYYDTLYKHADRRLSLTNRNKRNWWLNSRKTVTI